MTDLDIRIASADERPIIENLVQLYIHDFSELFAGTPRGDLAADGRYVIDIPLADWWSLADHVPLLLRYGGKLAGFALLNARPHGLEPVDHNMAEFFVLRKYRRLGIGTAAAHSIFTRYPGRWEAAVMHANTGALRFWDAAIRSDPRLESCRIGDGVAVGWNGTLLHFTIAAG